MATNSAKHTKAWQCFFDGVGKPFTVSEVTLPELKRKTEDFRTGSMLGAVTADFGVDKMEASITFEGESSDALLTFGICNASAVSLRLLASAEGDMDCDFMQVEHVMKGRWISVQDGAMKGGKGENTKAKLALTLYSKSIDGKEVYFIDVLNGIERSDGKDRTAERRKAIGMI